MRRAVAAAVLVLAALALSAVAVDAAPRQERLHPKAIPAAMVLGGNAAIEAVETFAREVPISTSPLAAKPVIAHFRRQGAYTLGWWLTAYGSIHITVEGNHFVGARYDQFGNGPTYVMDIWLGGMCRFGGVQSGDAMGMPFTIRFYPVYAGSACRGQGTGIADITGLYYGWWDQATWAEGQLVYSSTYVWHLWNSFPLPGTGVNVL